MSKKHINKLISIKFTDRKNPIYGFVVDYNDDWTLMKSNPVDYVIDGYVIFKHKNIDGYRRESLEKFKEKVIKLKGLEPKKEDLIPITDLSTILTYITKKFGVFEIYTKSETACYLGKLISVDSKALIIEFLDPDGKWDGEMKFRPNDIRVIRFDTDYINSLKLIAKK